MQTPGYKRFIQYLLPYQEKILIHLTPKEIIHVTDVLDNRKETSILVSREWMLMTHDMRKVYVTRLASNEWWYITFRENKKGKIDGVSKIGMLRQSPFK